MRCRVYPVIHHCDAATTIEQAAVAMRAGSDGVFLISHEGADDELPALGSAIKVQHPTLRVGLNFLTRGPFEAAIAAEEGGLDMVWGDACGVTSGCVNELAERLMLHRNASARGADPRYDIFAGVAFKGQREEPEPGRAAMLAARCGFIPTTSGTWTGVAPPIDKIKLMASHSNRGLAVASGMTPENVRVFAPHLTAILVATGVSTDAYHFCPDKLSRFISEVRRAC
jgi:predicted TIM-barrel enzyme